MEDPNCVGFELDAASVNPPNTKVGPEDFELLKVLGKGGYGKVCFINKKLQQLLFLI